MVTSHKSKNTKSTQTQHKLKHIQSTKAKTAKQPFQNIKNNKTRKPCLRFSGIVCGDCVSVGGFLLMLQCVFEVFNDLDWISKQTECNIHKFNPNPQKLQKPNIVISQKTILANDV
jgi:hypothetical protein